MKIRFRRSISNNITLSLLGYTAFTVVLLWFLQIAFLNSYYQYMQKSSVVSASKYLAAQVSQDSFEDTLESVCFSHRMCSLVLDSQGNTLYSIDMLGRGCLIHSNLRFPLYVILSPLMSGETDEIIKVFGDEHFRDNALIYARAVTLADGSRGVLVLNSWLEPVGSTQNILKSQLWIITAALVTLALVLSQLLARRLTRPLRTITDKAKRLANGDYTADYSGEGIEEIEKLAETLNYSADGLSKVEVLRRELIANVSHDLKTPLTMIKAYAEMIRDLTGDDKERRDQQLEVIIDEADRLSAFVNDLITVSRDEQDDRQYEPENIDLTALLGEMVKRFERICPQYNFDLSCPEQTHVTADRRATEQVVYNLISNAVNYTGEDHHVGVKALVKGNVVRVNITDTGRGIPESELPLIWERYYRSKNTHQRPVAGSGLGLSIVRNALEGQHLRYGVESKVGEGSCFWFEAELTEADAD